MAKPKKHQFGSKKTAKPALSQEMNSPGTALLAVSYVSLLFLMALVSPVSQSTLGPVYGFIPSSFYNHKALIVSCSQGGFLGAVYHQINLGGLLSTMAIYMFWIPVISTITYPYSQALGLAVGPYILAQVSCHAIIVSGAFSLSVITRRLMSLSRVSRPYIIEAAVGVLNTGLILHLESFFTSNFSIIWNSPMGSYGPVAVQSIVAILFASVPLSFGTSRDWKWLLAFPALLHTILLNPHLGTNTTMAVLTRSLTAQDWVLLERQWSNTGYISVLENNALGYRVLRCDHSLLGGEWILTPEREKTEGWKVSEPIYNVFEMLEAVRLVEVDPPIRDEDADALIIGLGIGTAPKAFVSHGINTTVLELDPVVHAFATKYFDLPANHTAILQDAIDWVCRVTSEPGHQTFDYILHDVFTGGAEPLFLFTFEFISRIRALLKPNGVIAINYAGDLTLPLTQRVMKTIDQVFDHSCKAFRDSSPPTPNSQKNEASEADFVNLVIFCRNTPGEVHFRKTRPTDFLQSRSRMHYLLPSVEQEVSFPDRGRLDTQTIVLRACDESQWTAQQLESAKRHWKIMRTVVPDSVWELW